MTRLPIVGFRTMDKVRRRLGFERARQKDSQVF